ncbi:MAG: GFA family protein [Acidimicrobiaceae bacterium]|nr:GFA family protein [Acidimicrobiaceae bacterium]
MADDGSKAGVRATGGCQCGGVCYRVEGPLRDVVNCHCEPCRRITGHHMAATAASVDDVHFESDATLGWYQRTAGTRYGFCTTCGSTLFWSRPTRPTCFPSPQGASTSLPDWSPSWPCTPMRHPTSTVWTRPSRLSAGIGQSTIRHGPFWAMRSDGASGPATMEADQGYPASRMAASIVRPCACCSFRCWSWPLWRLHVGAPTTGR